MHGAKPEYTAAAEALGRAIAGKGYTLVYGGGNVGLMGVLAESAMQAGGRVIGIIPERLFAMVEQQELTELLVVRDMHERKALMQEKADAFIALPGGIGTMEELFEVWSWRYIGYHHKPVGILDIGGFYAHLRALLSHMVDEGFVRNEIYEDLIWEEDAARLLQRLEERAASQPFPHLLKRPERRV
jgi:uncharacterized protein (TIGR00730 family)